MGSNDKGGFALLAGRAVVALGGDDARPFLQNLVTNDIEPADRGQAVYAALLTPQGKYLFDFFVVGAGDLLLLEAEAARLADLIKRLTLYKLRAAVTIADQSSDYAVAALFGGGRPPEIAEALVYADPRLAAAGYRVILPATDAAARLSAAGLRKSDAASYDRHRLALGLADGSADLSVDKTTILEANFAELHGVDFSKGCFVGQEVTARMHYKGLVRKRLLPVRIDGAAPAAGTELLRAGKRVGELRSSCDGLGLALLRLDRLGDDWSEATGLSAGDATIAPLKPEWFPK